MKNNINYQVIDIVKALPSKETLAIVFIQFSPDIKNIFNTRGKRFKLMDLDTKELSNEKFIELLSNNGKLVKRPFLKNNQNKFFLGFKQNEYAYYFK